jgi:hypothetical protein
MSEKMISLVMFFLSTAAKCVGRAKNDFTVAWQKTGFLFRLCHPKIEKFSILHLKVETIIYSETALNRCYILATWYAVEHSLASTGTGLFV